MHNDILQAFNTALNDAALGYEISWPNIDFTPPTSGVWLEVSHFPNRGIDRTLSGQNVIRQGMFQVVIGFRHGDGIFAANTAAQAVADVFPKLTALSNVKVSKVPYISATIDIEDGRVEMPLTIEYSG